MRTTVDMVYKASSKLYESGYVDDGNVDYLCGVFEGTERRKVALFALQNLGSRNRVNLFKASNEGKLLFLTEKNGRIYAYTLDVLQGVRSKDETLSNELLKQFELTKDGESYIKSLLR